MCLQSIFPKGPTYVSGRNGVSCLAYSDGQRPTKRIKSLKTKKKIAGEKGYENSWRDEKRVCKKDDFHNL